MNAALGVATRLRNHRGVALLHSARDDDGCGQTSFVACEPVQSIECHGRTISLYDRSGMVRERFDGDPLDVLQELVQEHTRRWNDDSGAVPVAIGYLGYDLGRLWHPFNAGRARAVGDTPDMWFGLYDSVWRFDEQNRRSDIVGKSAGARRSLAEAIARGDDSPGRPPGFDPLLGQGTHANMSAADERAEFVQQVELALQHLQRGDVQNIHLSRRLVAEIRDSGDPMALYAALIRAAPVSFGAFLSTNLGEQNSVSHIMSLSPARYLGRAPKAPTLESRPLSAIRVRNEDEERDAKLVAELRDGEAVRARHKAMVEQISQDFDNFASPGTITTESFGQVIERPTAYHLRSSVQTEVRPNAAFPNIIRATFPWAASTGIPRSRVMELRDALEPTRRGINHGAIGYIGLDGAMDLSFAMTTAVLSSTHLTVHVGDEVTAQSTAKGALAESERQADAWRKIWNLS